MQPRDIQRLEHIAEYCDSIAESVERFGTDFESFRADKAYHDLICFYLLQIGELAGQLSPEMRADSSDRMDWSQIRGMRNIVAHHYGSIRLEIVWNTVVNDIPALKAFCSELIGGN
jgi:uncharacterized protein with HEPN domain